MGSSPKKVPDPEQKGKPPTTGTGDNWDAAAVLTPPPTSPDAAATDTPTLIDPPPDAPTIEFGINKASTNPYEAPTMIDAAAAPTLASAGGFSVNQNAIVPGMLLGRRYEILSLLGEGGMGAVYKAMDRELNRPVALKVIRPELAKNKSIIDRFKQELLLARQVTHRNVIRIYDLGEADGVKFISMEFIEGEDLRSLLLRKKKLTPEEAIDVILQVCRALEAAHGAGVIHRDLKPQNIMCDASGRVVVMDFGLARTMASDGMTKTGALVGTMEYMSPEQVLGQTLDQRSDLFTVGLILYELLTGKMPFAADSAIASLIKRTQERAAPVLDHDDSIPRSLSDLVNKCLERDLNLRYQSSAELLADLEAWQGKRAGATLSFHAKVGPWGQGLPWPLIAAVATVILLAAVGWLWRDKFLSPFSKQEASAGPRISLAILPFRNASGDSSLDWIGSYLAETLDTDVGQSSSLRTVPSDRIRQLLHDLQLIPSSNVDAATLRRLETSSDAEMVVWGQYVKFGDQIRIDASLHDLKRERNVPLQVEAQNESTLPATIDHLAQAIRESLSLSASEVKELTAQAFKPSSRSLPALRDYNMGVELMRVGSYLEARNRMEAATKEDPEFALAYAKLSEIYFMLGYENDAEQASGKAVDLSEGLPPPERYRIAASHLRILRNYPKAIEAYESLAKALPNDRDVQSALGFLYYNSRDFDKARAFYGRILERDPKSVDALAWMGQVEVTSGNLKSALDYLDRALTIAIQGENDEEKALVLHVMGIAYRKLNKPDEAMRNFQESLAISRRLGEKAGTARTLNEMGQLLYGMGKSNDALKDYQDAMTLRREIGDKQGMGDTLIDLGNLYFERGDLDEALQRYQESLRIQRDLSDEASQAICLNNLGSVYLQKGDYQEGLTFYQQALQLREKLKVPTEIAETVHNLGDATLRMGQLDQALAYYLRAIELYRGVNSKRDVAIESHSTAMVFEYQGRYGAALNAEGEALKVFRELKDQSYYLGDILSSYGNALSSAGRYEEAQKNLEEALGVAREIKSEPLMAQISNYQGDLSFYQGDPKAARSQYEQALRMATHIADREKTIVAKINLSKTAIAEGRAQAAISSLKELMQEADLLGLKAYSVECSLYLGQALIATKDYTGAKQELQSSLNKSERMGLGMLRAKSHFLLATVLRLAGSDTDAASHYHEAVRLLDEIRKEPGVEKVTERADLKPIYLESARWSQPTKN
jgi:eukaryotic-like serine/threonine-protein kinase